MRELPYRTLGAWQKSMTLVEAILALSRTAPVASDRALRDQLVRAATSIPANLAEGHGRGTARDFAGFVDRARGSLFELDTWLEVLRRDGRLQQAHYDQLSGQILEINAMLHGLRTSLRTRAETDNRR